MVHGTLATRRVVVGSGDSDPQPVTDAPLIDVGPTGRAILTNTFLAPYNRPAAHNAGTLLLHSTTVFRAPGSHEALPTLWTAPGADTRVVATAFLDDGPAGATCAGALPVSYGYNLAPDESCGLDQTGDRQDLDDVGGPIVQDSLRVDAIPVGALHCGGGWSDDMDGEGTRPFDGDEDGTPACDIGADELTSS